MKRIGARFSLIVGVFAVLFSTGILYRGRANEHAHSLELVSQQAALAMEFDRAIRQYSSDVIRPEFEKRIHADEFVVEVMSTSYMAHSVFQTVRETFPECVLKFSSENPRNPENQAGSEEMEILRYFRDNPKEDSWSGKLLMNGHEYFAHSRAMRIEQNCLRCHGRPEDSPKALRDRYGGERGFQKALGEVAGMDVIAIPMEQVNASLDARARTNVLFLCAWLVLLFGAILGAFQWIVGRRLEAVSRHFQTAAIGPGDPSLQPIPLDGRDEISVLVGNYNALAARLETLHESLEDRVRQRTEELTMEQKTLRHLLQSSDHERQLIAYEIHDGLAQHLTGALMQLQAYEGLKQKNPDQAERAYRTGIRAIQDSLAEARRLISGVRPPILDELGVVAAIGHLVQDGQFAAKAAEIEFHHQVQFDRLSPVLENAIYRIVQEGLTNALRHGQTRKARVELIQCGKEIRLTVRDWGIGFRPETAKEGRFGLEGIRQRARLLGGRSQIESAPGQGTRIEVVLPVIA